MTSSTAMANPANTVGAVGTGGVAGVMHMRPSPGMSYQTTPSQIPVVTPKTVPLTLQEQALATAAALQSLSPPQQPVTPQAPLQSLTPQHQAINAVNLARMPTPTGPVAMPMPGTPSQGAVISLNTPNQTTLPLPGGTPHGQFFGYQGQGQSPQVGALQNPTGQTTPIQHQYQIQNVASLTAPNSSNVPQLMSPGGSVGLAPAANLGTAAGGGQQLNMYNVHSAPPATSTPVLPHGNTASIQSILMQRQPASVSNAGMVSNASANAAATAAASGGAMTPYSPMPEHMSSVNSAPMTYGNVGTLPMQHPMAQSMSNVHTVNPNMSPAATHLGYSAASHSRAPGGSLNPMTSPGMSPYVKNQGQYLPPMSPVTHSINTTLSGPEQQQQVQPFALNNYSMNTQSYSTPMNANSVHSLPQPAMLPLINQGLRGGTGSLVHGGGAGGGR